MITSAYLTAAELADLVGCEANQFACMARWLDAQAWPYVRDRRGLPKVARSFHDNVLAGVKAPNCSSLEPDFAAL